MKPQRRSKALETLARSIKDSDEFVTHVCNVAAAYAKHHAVDPAAGREVRQALRTFARHAGALSEWLQSAARAGSSSESQALRQIGAASRNPGSVSQSVALREWLGRVADVSSKAAEAPAGDLREDALRTAAEGVRATFEHHGIKLSQRMPQQKQSDAVRLLCAMVNQPGADEIEPAEAKQWLQPRPRPKDASKPSAVKSKPRAKARRK